MIAHETLNVFILKLAAVHVYAEVCAAPSLGELYGLMPVWRV